jgi:hypothetical protein
LSLFPRNNAQVAFHRTKLRAKTRPADDFEKEAAHCSDGGLKISKISPLEINMCVSANLLAQRFLFPLYFCGNEFNFATRKAICAD